MAVAVIFLILSSVNLLFSSGLASAETCGQYMQKINSFPDGYRARLNLPVLEAMNGWKVEIEFDKNIRVFDTPTGNLENGVKSGRKITILNYIHNRNLRASSKFGVEFTVHYQRGMIPPPKIDKIVFGNFTCEAKEEEVVKEECVFRNELPLCNSLLKKVNVWPDGYSAKLTLPVEKSVDSWELLLIFNKPIKVLDFPQGDLENKLNSTEFKIKSKDYNGNLMEGKSVTFDLTVHYERGQTWTNLVAVIFDPVQYICTNQVYKEILNERYKSDAYEKNDLIGSQWIGNCEESIPECKVVFQEINTWPDGFRGFLNIPIKETVNGWNITVFFDGKIRNFDVNQADKIKSFDNVYFAVRNHQYNARLVAGTIFKFEITVHFSRLSQPRPSISLVTFRNKEICENNEDC